MRYIKSVPGKMITPGAVRDCTSCRLNRALATFCPNTPAGRIREWPPQYAHIQMPRRRESRLNSALLKQVPSLPVRSRSARLPAQARWSQSVVSNVSRINALRPDTRKPMSESSMGPSTLSCFGSVQAPSRSPTFPRVQCRRRFRKWRCLRAFSLRSILVKSGDAARRMNDENTFGSRCLHNLIEWLRHFRDAS